MSERSESFLQIYGNLSEVTDPHVFGRDESNPYYDLLYSVAKELPSNLILELGTCTGGSPPHFAVGTYGKVTSIDIEFRPGTAEGDRFLMI
jgi:predicted O-methyltransferase YrrM